MRQPFDQDYYERYYRNPRTAVTSRAEMQRRAEMIAAAVHYIDLPVATILDAGCGMGLLRAPLLRRLKRAVYTGLEVSEYLCRRYGWRQGTIQSLSVRERFDLVVCYDVLQYLDEEQARKAIARISRVCRGALYFGVLTREDWDNNCDQTRTDRVPGLRPVRWYRRELQRHFDFIGCGMWLRRTVPIALWEMDHA